MIIPFLLDFLQVTSNMTLLVCGAAGGAPASPEAATARLSGSNPAAGGSEDGALVDQLQAVCKALMVVACLEDVMEDDEQYHNSVKLCLESFARREHWSVPGSGVAKGKRNPGRNRTADACALCSVRFALRHGEHHRCVSRWLSANHVR